MYFDFKEQLFKEISSEPVLLTTSITSTPTPSSIISPTPLPSSFTTTNHNNNQNSFGEQQEDEYSTPPSTPLQVNGDEEVKQSNSESSSASGI